MVGNILLCATALFVAGLCFGWLHPSDGLGLGALFVAAIAAAAVLFKALDVT